MSTLETIPEQHESLYEKELSRKPSPLEINFLQQELERSQLHHEHMKTLVDELEILHSKPILLVDAADRATMGKSWIPSVNKELLSYFVKIQTGREYDQTTFDYKKFVGQTFAYMFGFDEDDARFKKVSLVQGDTLPIDPTQYSLIIGTGGELNDFQTQPEYEDIRTSIRTFFTKVLTTKTPFAVTCATHQILGELIHELHGGKESIVDNLKDAQGASTTESGSVVFTLSDVGKTSLLTSELDTQFNIMSHHGQYLTQIPPGAVSLAYNPVCTTQILEYLDDNNNTTGIGFQGHPEMSNTVLMLLSRFTQATYAKNNQPIPQDTEVDTSATYSVRENVFPKVLTLIRQ